MATANAIQKLRSQTGTLYGIVAQNKMALAQKQGMMTPSLQHRASNLASRESYNPESTHIRQIKSGLEVSDQANLVRASEIAKAEVPQDNKENSSLDNSAVVGLESARRKSNV